MTRAQPSASNGGSDWPESVLVFVVEATVFAVQRVRKLQGCYRVTTGYNYTAFGRSAGWRPCLSSSSSADRQRGRRRFLQDQAALLAVSATFAVASLVMDAALAVASLTTWVKLVWVSVARVTNYCARMRSFSLSVVASSTCLVTNSAGVFRLAAAVAWARL